jgi:outer membrane PBP1 activator LpoA protein
MNHFRKSSLLILILILISILAGCDTQVPHAVSTNPSVAEPSANQQTMKSKQSDTQEKDANWNIKINDTQQITDEVDCPEYFFS